MNWLVWLLPSPTPIKLLSQRSVTASELPSPMDTFLSLSYLISLLHLASKITAFFLKSSLPMTCLGPITWLSQIFPSSEHSFSVSLGGSCSLPAPKSLSFLRTVLSFLFFFFCLFVHLYAYLKQLPLSRSMCHVPYWMARYSHSCSTAPALQELRPTVIHVMSA